jgi:hypothetical protein
MKRKKEEKNLERKRKQKKYISSSVLSIEKEKRHFCCDFVPCEKETKRKKIAGLFSQRFDTIGKKMTK